MDDAAAVCVVKRLRALVDDLHDVVDAKQIVRTTIRRQRARALYVLGNDVIFAVFFAGIVGVVAIAAAALGGRIGGLFDSILP